MGKVKKEYRRKILKDKGKNSSSGKPAKINASTPYELTNDRLSAFGGAFGLVKFFQVIEFEQIFKYSFTSPGREPHKGCYSMVYGIVLLLFIGFSRLGHFFYIQTDPLLCGIFGVDKLASHTTYWRFLNSLGINQSQSLQLIVTKVRERVWKLCQFNFKKIHIDIDTTVETIYGEIEGARKGHNTQHRGKKGLRPILAFISETREYLCGKLRKGTTVGAEEFTAFLYTFPRHIPRMVETVILRADGEFISGKACQACEALGFYFVFGNKRCDPPFIKSKWYKVHKKDVIEYNSIEYQPLGWDKKYRFVAMRIPRDKKDCFDTEQLSLFEKDSYLYRIFVTNLKGAAHKVIREYDYRADVENLIGESKREGLAAIPSKKFKNNYAFFQIVMLSFNIWRYLKFFAAKAEIENRQKTVQPDNIPDQIKIIEHPLVKHTARIARLKLLFISAKMTCHDNRATIKYSIHDNRSSELFILFEALDVLRKQKRPWDPLPVAA